MTTLDDLQKSINDLRTDVDKQISALTKSMSGLWEYMRENMATKQDLRDLEGKMDDKFATKEELRNYAAFVEKAVANSAKFEEQTLAHRQEHDDLLKRVEDIEAVPVVAHSLRKN